VRRGQAATARARRIGLCYFKGKLHSGSVSGENPCDSSAQ
jgi:hypothetical protein